jgi:hypothetical protein
MVVGEVRSYYDITGFSALTTHEVVDDGVDGAVRVAQPMGQQGDGHHGVWAGNVHRVSARQAGDKQAERLILLIRTQCVFWQVGIVPLSSGLQHWVRAAPPPRITREYLTGHVKKYFAGYKVEEKLHVGVREQRGLDTTDLDENVCPRVPGSGHLDTSSLGGFFVLKCI